jgi:hypothetical protein
MTRHGVDDDSEGAGGALAMRALDGGPQRGEPGKAAPR